MHLLRVALFALCYLSPAFCLAALPVSDPVSECESSLQEGDATESWFWYDLYERQGFLAIGALGEAGGSRGIIVGYGTRVDSDESLGRGAVWLARAREKTREDISLRADFALWYFAWSWGGVGPLFGLGVEDRSEGPEEGFGGFLAFGIEIAVWTHEYWQTTLSFERDFGISTDSRNALRLSVALAHETLTIGEPAKKP